MKEQNRAVKNMSDKFQDRTMAFAGICQAAYLVQKVARDGSCDEASPAREPAKHSGRNPRSRWKCSAATWPFATAIAPWWNSWGRAAARRMPS